MDRRTFLYGSVSTALAMPLAAEAQRTANIPRIGVLVPAEPEAKDSPNVAAFRQGLRDLGYVEGQTVAVEYRYGHGETERYADLVTELVRLNADIIVVGSGPAARAAKNVTQAIPVVFVGAGDPVGNKLVASLGRPGGNLTGLSFAFEDGFAEKWVELLKQTLPNLTHLTFLHDPGALMGDAFVRDAQKAARALGLKLQSISVRQPDEFEGAFIAIARQRGGALAVAHSVFFFAQLKRIVNLATTHRVPAIYPGREFVDAGGLMSHGVSLPDLWRRSASHVEKILKGAKPGDLPVEQPTKFELVINMKTAKALGLTIPPSLLLRADQVIE